MSTLTDRQRLTLAYILAALVGLFLGTAFTFLADQAGAGADGGFRSFAFWLEYNYDEHFWLPFGGAVTGCLIVAIRRLLDRMERQ